ncbi:phage baseplate protein [Ensifer adhaerens]|nr:phage baseplate protein [Ensifer adhaerens]
MFDQIADEFRSIYKSIDDAQRRAATTMMTGKVTAIDGKRIRLELLPVDGRTGKPFLSPWVQCQEAAGITSTNTPVRLGDPMRLLSPNGELGPQSLAIRDSHTEDNPNPANGDELVIGHDGAVIRMSSEAIVFELDGMSIRLSGGKIDITSSELTHNGRNIGSTHVHGGIERGGSDTATPH